jgi:hypothetical protein
VAPSYTDFQPTELEANPQQEFDTLENQANAPVRGPYETARSVDIANWTLLSTMLGGADSLAGCSGQVQGTLERNQDSYRLVF